MSWSWAGPATSADPPSAPELMSVLAEPPFAYALRDLFGRLEPAPPPRPRAVVTHRPAPVAVAVPLVGQLVVPERAAEGSELKAPAGA